MRQDKKVKRVIPISWRYLLPGIALLLIGVFVASIYMNDRGNVFAGMASAITLATGGLLTYQGVKSSEAGFSFNANGQRKRTGRENAIILFAKRNAETSKDMPVLIKFVELVNPPKGARLHYVRNLKKHYFEFINNTVLKKLEPVVLPDKKSFPPDMFKIPAAMQTYKDALEYSPPTMLQKVAPGILLLAMVIVGILMVMTNG